MLCLMYISKGACLFNYTRKISVWSMRGEIYFSHSLTWIVYFHFMKLVTADFILSRDRFLGSCIHYKIKIPQRWCSLGDLYKGLVYDLKFCGLVGMQHCFRRFYLDYELFCMNISVKCKYHQEPEKWIKCL